MNADETILRRVKNARTIHGGDDVVVNDVYGGFIDTAGALLHFLLGEVPLAFDEDRDLDLPLEEADQ